MMPWKTIGTVVMTLVGAGLIEGVWTCVRGPQKSESVQEEDESEQEEDDALGELKREGLQAAEELRGAGAPALHELRSMIRELYLFLICMFLLWLLLG